MMDRRVLKFAGSRVGIGVACGLLLAGGAAFGQAGTATKTDEPVLKGPEVKERSVPGVVSTFGQGGEARRMAERIPPEVLREALGVLTRDDAPPEIRATDEQKQKFTAITDELRAAVRAYMAEHRDELIELRREANLSGRAAQELDRAIGRRGGAGAAAGDGDARRQRPQRPEEKGADAAAPMTEETTPEQQEAARQRLRELMAGAPKIEDYLTRVWEGLSPAQREAVEAKLDEYREREAKKREEAYVRQRVGERQPEGGPRRPAAAAPGGDDMTMQGDKPAGPEAAQRPRPNAANAQRRERLMRLFERLSPEQQEMLLERLENAVREGGGPARQRGQRPQPSADKPAPGMDEVDVPKPEDVEKEPPSPPRRKPDPA